MQEEKKGWILFVTNLNEIVIESRVPTKIAAYWFWKLFFINYYLYF